MLKCVYDISRSSPPIASKRLLVLYIFSSQPHLRFSSHVCLLEHTKLKYASKAGITKYSADPTDDACVCNGLDQQDLFTFRQIYSRRCHHACLLAYSFFPLLVHFCKLTLARGRYVAGLMTCQGKAYWALNWNYTLIGDFFVIFAINWP